MSLADFLKRFMSKEKPVPPELLSEAHTTRLRKYKDDIITYATKYKLNHITVAALIVQESSVNPYAVRFEQAFMTRYTDKTRDIPGMVSSAHWDSERICRSTSWGLMQIMGLVAREYGYGKLYLSELVDPHDNLDIGCKHLSTLIQRKGDEVRGLLAYNGGGDERYPSRIETWRRRIEASGIFS